MMLNGNLYSFYLYILLVVLLPIFVVLKDDNGKNTFISNSIPIHSRLGLQSVKGDQMNLKVVNDSMVEDDNRKYTLVETLRRTFNEFEELFENIVDIVAKNVPKIARDAEIFLAKLSNRTMDALNIFSNKILNEGDDLLNEMFYNIERQLDSVRNEFQNLAISVDEHFNWAVTQLNQTLINNTEEYDWWTAHIKQKLRTVNDTKLYQEGCSAIDEFLTQSTKELHNCCKITMKPMRSLCKSASSLITEALHTIVDAIDRMQACLEEKRSYLDYMLPCIHLAYDEISNLVSRAAQITHQVNNMLPMKIIYTRSCFAIVMVDMNVRRNNIESGLFSN
ncbi:uncharacterized protein LOC119602784 [Lucilia sericata]|uniref:uncharacterized protein LOC119602784 n=1 Tax=Lucilia sericata TaxID=13632 RepID=UPI0018A87A1C|nr:uncharacterized protein LOC119602784 [Lucilia sericata]